MENEMIFKIPYFQTPNKIFELDITEHELVTYMYICRCGNNSTAFPSYKDIGVKTKTSQKTAQRAITGLIEKGLITKTNRFKVSDKDKSKVSKASNIYKINTNLDGYGQTDHRGIVTQTIGYGQTDHRGIVGLTNKEELVEEKLIKENNTSENNSDENEKPIEEEKKVFDKESAEYKMAVYLYNKLKELNPGHKKPDFQKWAKEADYLIRLDKRHNLHEIKAIIDWTFDNSFWKSKVLSISGLRKHYDTLIIQMNNDSKNNKNTVVNMNERRNNNTDTQKQDAYDDYIKANSKQFLEQYRNKNKKINS